jgi:hypothetical protein
MSETPLQKNSLLAASLLDMEKNEAGVPREEEHEGRALGLP